MSDSVTRLSALRQALGAAGLEGFIVPRADERLGEYVPACAERLAWLTGFTGSAGLAAILPGRAAVFTDGRYTLQLEAQTDAALYERRHLIEEPPHAWLKQNGPDARIGYDPHLISGDALARYVDAGLTMVATASNPIDGIWHDRPAAPMAVAVPHPLAYAGVSSAEKREQCAAGLREAGQHAAVLTDPASVNWLLNIRGSDLAYTPFALAFAIVHDDASVQLFIEPGKMSAEMRAWLGNGVTTASPDRLDEALAAMQSCTVRVDRNTAPVWFAQRLKTHAAIVADAADPCTLAKASKNGAEQQGARRAHLRDAVAVCRFLHWLAAGRGDGATEMQAAERLLALRAEAPEFREESFPAISGSGPNGAIIHYRVTAGSDRVLGADEVYLIDSGGQYLDGTTDVTRTVWTGPGDAPDEVRDRFTRVLQGHIAIAAAVFPKGVAGPHLDALARRALWQAGLDYDHGTGHGVGSYLSVHEGPASLSRHARLVPLAAGMILSDEPGYYQPGAYGIRLENLLLIQPRPFQGAKKPFFGFETLTLAPFDRTLIDPGLLTAAEREWVDAYHARVLAEVGPRLAGDDRAWLHGACRAL